MQGLIVQESPKPDVEEGRYEMDSASSTEKQVENSNSSEQRTSPSVESSCSGSSASPPELAKDGCTTVRSIRSLALMFCRVYRTKTQIFKNFYCSQRGHRNSIFGHIAKYASPQDTLMSYYAGARSTTQSSLETSSQLAVL